MSKTSRYVNCDERAESMLESIHAYAAKHGIELGIVEGKYYSSEDSAVMVSASPAMQRNPCEALEHYRAIGQIIASLADLNIKAIDEAIEKASSDEKIMTCEYAEEAIKTARKHQRTLLRVKDCAQIIHDVCDKVISE